MRDGRSVTGLAILGTLIVFALLAPAIAPTDPSVQRDVLQTRLLAPLATGPDGMRHWLGTDQFGRDMLSRLLYGARISLAVGFLAVAVSVLLGTLIGAGAAVAGGVTERALMAATDAALALPRVVLLLALVALWEPSLHLVILVLGFTGWMGVARLARAEVKTVLTRPFVTAGQAAGLPPLRLLRRHVLPNALTPVVIATALGVGNAISLEAGLSFLGLGVPPPAPSWGNMISAGRETLINAPWIATFPGLAVVLAVIGCNLLGDGVRDALDPSSRYGSTTRVTTSRGPHSTTI